MEILICNAGSTSLKFKLYDMPSERLLASCTMERVGDPAGGRMRYSGGAELDKSVVISDYETGIRMFLKYITGEGTGVLTDVSRIAAVGFKTVLSRGHYGVHRIDEEVMRGMWDMLSVAPAHNRHYLAAIGTFQKVLPNTPLVGVFETAFHQTLPPEAYIYSVPYEWHERYGVRRFGYHGASHSYVADCLTKRLGPEYRAVSCHLGGSCSLCAILDGKSVDTSFGISLQTGLPQSNRSGDLDPFLVRYMVKAEGMSMEEVFQTLETRGGLLGISGVSGDLRDVEMAANGGNQRAALAIRIFQRELLRYIGGYASILGGLDAVALTGGIGENSKSVQDCVLLGLSYLGAVPGVRREEEGIYCLTDSASPVSVFIIPANEELGVARRTYESLNNTK